MTVSLKVKKEHQPHLLKMHRHALHIPVRHKTKFTINNQQRQDNCKWHKKLGFDILAVSIYHAQR